MNKRLDLLDKLKICINTDSSPSIFLKIESLAEVEELFKVLENYYELKDLEMGTRHHEIFKMLYLEKNTYTFDQISIETCIALQTLDRYRQNYNSFAKKVITLLQERNST